MLAFKPNETILNEIEAGQYHQFIEIVNTGKYTTLHLHNTRGSPLFLAHLFEAIKSTPTLTTLNLRANDITDEGVAQFAPHLKDTHLETLNLWNNQITAKGAAMLIGHAHQTKLKTLLLGGNQIGPHVEAMSKSLEDHQGITTLNMNQNELSDKGATLLVKAVASSSVKHLFLSHNNITDSGLELVTLYAKNTKLESIQLALNQFTEIGTIKLLSLLKDVACNLTKMNVGLNRLDAPVLERVSNAILNKYYQWGANLHVLDATKVLYPDVAILIASKIAENTAQKEAFLKGWFNTATVKERLKKIT